MTTPPTPAPPSFDDVKTVVQAFLVSAFATGQLKQELGAFLDGHVHVWIADALAQLGAPGDPLTAWLNGWMTQIRTDYSPGGVLEQTLKNAAHSVKVFLPNPEGEDDVTAKPE